LRLDFGFRRPGHGSPKADLETYRAELDTESLEFDSLSIKIGTKRLDNGIKEVFMPIEQYTESLVLQEMKCTIGENAFGFVFPQGDVSSVDKLEKLLKKADGKPAVCPLADYSQGGNGKAKPEFVITFNKHAHTIIVVECKNSVKKHISEKLDCPRDFAVDGVLYYAKFLKEGYNVIALAVSETAKEKFKVTAFY
jgi:hypothetical protein